VASRSIAFPLVCAAVLAASLPGFAAEEGKPDTYRRPGSSRRLPPLEPYEGEGEVRIPRAPLPGALAVPDRWRLAEDIGVKERWWDPYHQNTLKADRPIFGQDWFFELSFISDTLINPRRLPTPIASQASERPGSLDTFGRGDQLGFNQNLILTTSLIKGDTVFRPPDLELRVTTVGNINYADVEERGVLNVDPDEGTTRLDGAAAFQQLFVDVHLGNKSDRYDFDSLRVGIQTFVSDFRGFLFLDQPVGIRLFGNFLNNRIQYNVGYFRRFEKDTNSGLNTIFQLREDDVFVLNGFLQDFPVFGFTSEALVLYNRNDDRDFEFNTNEFLERPAPVGDAAAHGYDVVYPGIGGDGHFGRVNLTYNFFLAAGHETHNPIAQRPVDVFAHYFLGEASVDFDWYRLKAFVAHASGDGDPYDDTGEGFDAIFENPNFAGAVTSFWVPQSIPLIGGGGVALKGRNALLPSLRTSKEQGQSNFVNPGLILAGVGTDLDVLPQLRILGNLSWLGFDETAALEVLRQQANVAQDIGYDLSVGVIYRPLFIENIVFNLSGAVLFPGQGFKDLFADRDDVLYSTIANVVLTY
jgi:hypothetical protein